MLKLYYSPGACSLASHIALCESGLPFEAIKVDGRAKTAASGESYWDVTAKGYVPALRLDDGAVLTESTAILPYIADRNPAAALAPAAGTLARYRLQEWLGYINSEVHKSFAAFFTPGATDAMKLTARENLTKKFNFIAKELAGKSFLMGEQYSVADSYLFTVLGWLRATGGLELVQWPALQAFHARVAARPASIAAMKAEGLLK
jgi:glutathione S-transferase